MSIWTILWILEVKSFYFNDIYNIRINRVVLLGVIKDMLYRLRKIKGKDIVIINDKLDLGTDLVNEVATSLYDGVIITDVVANTEAKYKEVLAVKAAMTSMKIVTGVNPMPKRWEDSYGIINRLSKTKLKKLSSIYNHIPVHHDKIDLPKLARVLTMLQYEGGETFLVNTKSTISGNVVGEIISASVIYEWDGKKNPSVDYGFVNKKVLSSFNKLIEKGSKRSVVCRA